MPNYISKEGSKITELPNFKKSQNEHKITRREG